eukprot:gene6987-9415_t
MPAYMIVTAKLKDRDAFIAGYGKAAAELLPKFGGRYVLRGPGAMLLHKPAGFEAGLGLPGAPTGQAAHASRSQGAPQALTLLNAASHLPEDASGIRVLQRHFRQLECFTPLPTEASGLVVYTQDKRIARKLAEDIEVLEQECIVEVKGDITPGGLQRLCHGLTFNGRPLPPIKVSWQNETRLRFALKGIRPGQIPAMCEAVGLTVVGIKRIRIGRVPLAKVPEGLGLPKSLLP